MVPQSTRLKSMLNAQLIVKRSFLFAPRSLTNAAEAKGLSEMGGGGVTEGEEAKSRCPHKY